MSCNTKQPGTSRKVDCRGSARRFLCGQFRVCEYLVGDLQYASERRVRTESDDRDRRQAELYEATNGREGGTLKGNPVIILTFKGSKFGKIRKAPPMRIEHNDTYAVVASDAGAPAHPFWYRNIVANPLVELLYGAIKQRDAGPRSSARKSKNGGSALTRHRISPPTEPAQAATFWCTFSRPGKAQSPRPVA